MPDKVPHEEWVPTWKIWEVSNSGKLHIFFGPNEPLCGEPSVTAKLPRRPDPTKRRCKACLRTASRRMENVT